MASVEWWKCSVLCTETLSGLSSGPWRMSTNGLLQRYQTTSHTTWTKSNVFESTLSHVTHHYSLLASAFYSFFSFARMEWLDFSPSCGLSVLMSYLSQFNHMVETHKCFSKHMLEQLQEVTYSNHRNLRRLEEQERNHKTFSQRSKCLTTQLEQDRERYVC